MHAIPAILAGVLFVLGWLVPNHYLPWTSFYNDFSAAAGLATLSTYAVWVSRGQTIRLPLPAFLLLAVALIPLIQAATGHIFLAGDGWIAALYVGGLAAAYVTGLLLARRDDVALAELLAWLFLVGALISTFIALVQWLRIGGLGLWVMDLKPGSRPYSNIAQFNNLASLLVLGLASVVFLFERFRLEDFSASVCGAVLIFGVAMTQSRTPWVALAVLLMWWAWKRRRIGLRASPRVLFVATASYAILVFSWPTLAKFLYLGASTLDERFSAGLRPVVWRQLLEATRISPWHGFGWNQVSVAQVHVAQDYPSSVLVEHSHNILLDILLWNGIPIGAILIAATAYWGLSRALRCRSLATWFALLVVAIVSVHGMLEFPLEYAYFLFPVGIAAGLVDAQQQPLPRLGLSPKVAGLIVASAIGVLSWVWIEYDVAEKAHRAMRYESARIGHPPTADLVPKLVLLSQLREFIRFARTQARAGMKPEEIEWMRRVAYRYPYPPAMFRYALARGLNGDIEGAKLEMIRLRQLHGLTHYSEAKQSIRQMGGAGYPQLKELSLP